MLDFHLYSALTITVPLQSEDYTEAKREAVRRHYEKIVTDHGEQQNLSPIKKPC